MALTGLQIFKHLPGGKKESNANCKKCGFPTCMAFAMKLAKNDASIENCEFISDELNSMLKEASLKQQEEIVFGSKNNRVKIGNETVMFRHEKTFINPTCIAVKLNSDDVEFDKKLAAIASYSIERVGEEFKISAIALFGSENFDFASKAQQIDELGIPLILTSSNQANILSALEAVNQSKPLVKCEGSDLEFLAKIEKEFDVPVVISAESVQKLAEISDKALNLGIKQIVLNLEESGNVVKNLTYLRRSAIENKFKPLGFPVLSFVKKTVNIFEEAVLASAMLCKYSNLLIFEDLNNALNNALITAMFTLRQNIYTDPQKPLQVEAKLYEIGEVNENSPVFVTTNFALTYFAVANEIEASGVPSYLLITPSDGMSVLTAWSASKFTGEIIAKAFKESKIEELAIHRNLILPGFVGAMKEEIEEELPAWRVVNGPNEAIDIVDFLKRYRAD